MTNVQPIPEKGDSTGPSKYSPIAMERIIIQQLLGHLKDNQLVTDCQYAFRFGQSAEDILVYVMYRWAESIETKGDTMAISLDIAKAFDRF